MFIGLLQIRHSLTEHSRFYLFSFFVLFTWLIWLVKVVLSRQYRPWTAAHHATTSVVIPVVDEPLDLFRQVLQRIVEQAPTQILVVINGPRNRELEAACEEFGRPSPTPGRPSPASATRSWSGWPKPSATSCYWSTATRSGRRAPFPSC